MDRFTKPVLVLVMCVMGLACSLSAYSQAQYTITDLGSLGGSVAVAYGINSSGQIVGESRTATDSNHHAFIWSNGVMTDLGHLSGQGSDSIPQWINDYGIVVGSSGNITSGGTWHAFVWSNGTMTDVGTLPGYPISSGGSVNNQGVVAATASMQFSDPSSHPFLWSNGTITDPGIPGAVSAIINDLGHLTGEFQPVPGTFHTYLWDNGSTIDLGTLPGFTYSLPEHINAYDQVVGSSYNQSSQAFSGHAFLWSNGQMTDLGTLGGAYSFGLGINNLGDVVGMADTIYGAVDAFFYHNGIMYDLNNLIPSVSGLSLFRADGINDSGQICASGTINSETHAYLLTPVSLDTTPPVITTTTPANGTVYTLNQSVTASYSCTDPDSSCAATGTVANGSPIDTASVGAKSFTVTATDPAGNKATQTVTYSVAYAVQALYDQTRAVKSGAVYPIKLQVNDANGVDVSSSSLTVHAVSVAMASTNAPGALESAGDANPDNDFRFDSTLGTAGGYIFNLKTTGLGTGTYNLNFTAGSDPTIHTVQFQVK